MAAAVALGQSFFNARGFGEVTPANDARTAGMGSPEALSGSNPGIWVNLGQTYLSASGIVGALVGSHSGSSRFLGAVRPVSVGGAVPLPWQTRLIMGMDTRFNQDFDVWSESLSDTTFRRHVVGRGGIYALKLGLAKSLFGSLCLGVAYNHVLGGSREKWLFEVAPGGASTTDTIEVDYAGNTLQIGASFQPRLFSLAACYEPELSLDAHRSKLVHGTINDSFRTYTITLPGLTRLAAGFDPTPRLGVNLGLELRPWSDAEVDTIHAGFRNTWRLSAGAEYELASGYPVRIGYSHQNWYFDAVPAIDPGFGLMPISENGLHVGTSFPIPKFGSLDLSGSVFLRRAGDQTETAGQLMLTLAYHEAWTRRTRRWGY